MLASLDYSLWADPAPAHRAVVLADLRGEFPPEWAIDPGKPALNSGSELSPRGPNSGYGDPPDNGGSGAGNPSRNPGWGLQSAGRNGVRRRPSVPTDSHAGTATARKRWMAGAAGAELLDLASWSGRPPTRNDERPRSNQGRSGPYWSQVATNFRRGKPPYSRYRDTGSEHSDDDLRADGGQIEPTDDVDLTGQQRPLTSKVYPEQLSAIPLVLAILAIPMQSPVSDVLAIGAATVSFLTVYLVAVRRRGD